MCTFSEKKKILKTTTEAYQGVCNFVTLQTFFILKQQHYTVKKVENVSKKRSEL